VRIQFLLLFSIALLWVGCVNDSNQSGSVTIKEPPKKTYAVPPFDQNSAYDYIQKQVDFGPRVPNTDAHDQCRQFLADELRSQGLTVIEQRFKAPGPNNETLNGTNIIGQYNPKAKRRIFLAAHWDTRYTADSPINEERHNEPILGADDGGSGVGILLELARVLKENPIEGFGIDIIFYDAEDQGTSGGSETTWCLGSQHWSRNLHAANYQPRYGILLDMVGSSNPRFTKDQISMTYAGPVMNKVWQLANAMGHGNMFVNIPTDPLVDDHYFVNTIAGLPMIDIINRPAGSQTGFGDYWHTHDDDMSVIDKNTLKAVGQVITAVVYREASGTFM
jgi:glutaminyl-peptide cyclotransferase